MKIKRKDGIYKLTFIWDPPINISGRNPDRMEWEKLEITQRIFDGPNCYPWRPAFAFTPVKTITGQEIWLRRVYKRRFWAVWGQGFHMEPEVEYATLLEILGEQ